MENICESVQIQNTGDKLGQVVQNFVGLTVSISHQFINYIWTSKANALLFFVEKMGESFALHSHFFNKNNNVFVILPFEM